MNIRLNLPFVRRLIKTKFGTANRLADAIGIHRNSISNYLSGKCLLPDSVEKILNSLGVNSMDAFNVVSDSEQTEAQQVLANVIGGVVRRCPDSSIILFGSRARKKNRKYSDFDLGVLRDGPLSLKEWSDLRNIVDENTEDLPFQVDLVDLGRADEKFLSGISRDAKFLGGSPKYYLELFGKRGKYE